MYFKLCCHQKFRYQHSLHLPPQPPLLSALVVVFSRALPILSGMPALLSPFPYPLSFAEAFTDWTFTIEQQTQQTTPWVFFLARPASLRCFLSFLTPSSLFWGKTTTDRIQVLNVTTGSSVVALNSIRVRVLFLELGLSFPFLICFHTIYPDHFTPSPALPISSPHPPAPPHPPTHPVSCCFFLSPKKKSQNKQIRPKNYPNKRKKHLHQDSFFLL